MSITWIRLGLYDDPSKTFLLPTFNISTYSNLSQLVHSIFRVSADDFPTFDLFHTHEENDDLSSPPISVHLWDLGVYFAAAAESAVTVFVRFKPLLNAMPRMADADADAARGLLAINQHDEAELPPLPPQQSQQQQKQNKEEKGNEKEREERDKRARSISDSSNPVVVTKHARLHSPSPSAAAGLPSGPTQQDGDGNDSSSSLSDLGSEVERELAEEQRQKEQEKKKKDEEDEKDEDYEDDDEEEEQECQDFATLRFNFVNRMTKSHNAVVSDLVVPQVPAGKRLVDFEDEVKTHASEAFLRVGGSSMSKRQAFALGECLAVRILIGGGDALRERKTVAKYAKQEAAPEEGPGAMKWVLRGTVEMWREKDIEMELMRRASPTSDAE